MSASIGVDEVNEILLGTGAIVGKRLGGSLLEVLDSGVRGDTLFRGKSLAVLSFGVDFGDDNTRLGDEVAG